jgi:hypothetical protein
MRLLVASLLMATFLGLGGTSASAGGAKIEVQLLWGTDAPKSPNPDHKPVDADIKNKLKDSPYKWANYFLVKKLTLVVPSGGSDKQAVSEKCAIEVRDKGNSMFEFSYFGKDKKVETRTQSFPKGETLFYGGNAPGTNAWMLVLKRLQ